MKNVELNENKSIKTSIEVSIRLAFLFLIIAWCLVLLYPFIEPVLWGIIIAVSISPLYLSLSKKLGGRSKLAASLVVFVFLSILLIPSYLIIESSVESLNTIGKQLETGTLVIPPPNSRVAEWPVIGEEVYEAWKAFSINLEAALNSYESQLVKAGKWMLGSVVSVSGDILKFVLSIIITGVLLATKGTNEVTRKFFNKLVGEKGKEFAELTEKTITNVTKGILGVAFIQGVLLSLLFLLAGVPYAGLWGIACLILGILQLPPTLVSIPIIVYLYSVGSPTMATVWAVLIVLASISDTFLKPILLGKGAPVPMLVIFLGAIGGFMVSGFLGLFTGAIVLSLGYKLFLAWLNASEAPEQAD